MARRYPGEFRRRVVALAESGRRVKDLASDLGVSEQSIYNWLKQARVDRGDEAGASTHDKAELRAMRRRVRELETELAVHRRATELPREPASPNGETKPPK